MGKGPRSRYMHRLYEERCLEQKKIIKKNDDAIIEMQISSLWKPLKGTAEFACTDTFELLERTFDHWVWQSSDLLFVSFFCGFYIFNVLVFYHFCELAC